MRLVNMDSVIKLILLKELKKVLLVVVVLCLPHGFWPLSSVLEMIKVKLVTCKG